MNAPKKSGIVFILAGTVLILSALSLLLYTWYNDARVGQEAEHLLTDVQTIIEERETTVPGTVSDETTPPEPIAPELPITEIEGYGYVGYIYVPKLELELPVMSEWDYARLKIAPCRQFGSSRTNNLVIAAHNYKKHFGYLYQLEVGDRVIFTDMDGIENHYQVTTMETLNPIEVEAVQNSGHDLVLYTCTYGGKRRVVVFCDRLEETLLQRLPSGASGVGSE